MTLVVTLDRRFATKNVWMPFGNGIRARCQLGNAECVIDTALRWQKPKKHGDDARFVHPLNEQTWQVESSSYGGVCPIRVSLQLSNVDDEANAFLRSL